MLGFSDYSRVQLRADEYDSTPTGISHNNTVTFHSHARKAVRN